MKNKENITTEKDWFLQTLVGMVNNSELTMGLTIATHGFLVSGDLVGGKEYFKAFGEDINKGTESKSIGKIFEDIGEKVYSEEKQKKDGNPAYIHLKDAKYFNTNGNPIPGNQGIWWRGRLSEISGFSLGKLNLE